MTASPYEVPIHRSAVVLVALRICGFAGPQQADQCCDGGYRGEVAS